MKKLNAVTPLLACFLAYSSIGSAFAQKNIDTPTPLLFSLHQGEGRLYHPGKVTFTTYRVEGKKSVRMQTETCDAVLVTTYAAGVPGSEDNTAYFSISTNNIPCVTKTYSAPTFFDHMSDYSLGTFGDSTVNLSTLAASKTPGTYVDHSGRVKSTFTATETSLDEYAIVSDVDFDDVTNVATYTDKDPLYHFQLSHLNGAYQYQYQELSPSGKPWVQMTGTFQETNVPEPVLAD